MVTPLTAIITTVERDRSQTRSKRVHGLNKRHGGGCDGRCALRGHSRTVAGVVLAAVGAGDRAAQHRQGVEALGKLSGRLTGTGDVGVVGLLWERAWLGFLA